MVRIDEYIQQPGQRERVLRDVIRESLHVAVPGEIVSYNPTTRTAVIQPVIRGWNSKESPPLLVDVPVYFFADFVYPINKGDECLVVFADSCIDAWFANSGVNVPVSARKHDLSDGFAFVGFRSKKKVTPGVDIVEKINDIPSKNMTWEEFEA